MNSFPLLNLCLLLQGVGHFLYPQNDLQEWLLLCFFSEGVGVTCPCSGAKFGDFTSADLLLSVADVLNLAPVKA